MPYPGESLIADHDFTVGGVYQAGENFEQSGFACAIFPSKCVDLAGWKLQSQPIECSHPGEITSKVMDTNRRDGVHKIVGFNNALADSLPWMLRHFRHTTPQRKLAPALWPAL